MSETKEDTTLVKAAAILRKGISQRSRRRERSTYIKPTATSKTLSRRAKSEKPSQARWTRFWTFCSAFRRNSPLSSRRGIGGCDGKDQREVLFSESIRTNFHQGFEGFEYDLVL